MISTRPYQMYIYMTFVHVIGLSTDCTLTVEGNADCYHGRDK